MSSEAPVCGQVSVCGVRSPAHRVCHNVAQGKAMSLKEGQGLLVQLQQWGQWRPHGVFVPVQRIHSLGTVYTAALGTTLKR